MKADVAIVDVTPKMASDWLENIFDGQRTVRDTHVSRLATEILEGRWKLSCDAITLIKGKLGNGQHRCWAITMANRTCQCLVLRTDDDKLFDVIDSGIARTAADVLNGYDFQYSQVIAAASKLVLMHQKGLITRLGSTVKKTDDSGGVQTVVTRGEILEYAKDNQASLLKHAQLVCSLYSEKTILQKSYSCAFLELASKKNQAKAIDFITGVYRGGQQDASFDLRERLIKNKMSKSRLPQSYVFGLVIKSFKAYLNGERLGVLKMVEGERFPTI